MTTAERAPTAGRRRRPGGARPDGPLLERQQIVEAALALTQRYGLGGMSMRKLGDELGVTSMAIYWYFKGKDELVDAVTDSVLGQIVLPDATGLDWEQRLRGMAWAVHDVLVRYPGIADQLLTYQNFPPSTVPLVEYAVSALRDAGFSEERATTAFNVLSSYVVTRSHFEAHQRLVTESDDGDTTVKDRALSGWQRLADAVEHAPNARTYVTRLAEVGDPALVFDHGLELLLRGLRDEITG